MKATRSLIFTTAAAILLSTATSPAKERPSKRANKASEAEPWNAKEKRYQAELKAEANAPGMPAADYRRVVAALAARKAAEDHEIAQFQQYKSEQKIAMAEASAPKNYIINGGKLPGNFTPSSFASRSKPRLQTVAYTSSQTVSNSPRRDTTTSIIPSRGTTSSGYPERFARKMAQEESFDRQDAMLDAQQRSEDMKALLSSAPFGQPVPGMPGYMSSPPSRFQGYIDVRGYRSGTEVTDPYTGERVRVP